MATLQDMVDQIITDTRRVDRTAQIETYVKKAVRHAHSLTNFKQDLIDTSVVVTAGQETLGSISLPANFRAAELVRPLVGSSYLTGVKFKQVSPELIPQMENGEGTLNTFYITQGTLHYNSATAFTAVALLYYSNPDLSDLANETWLTRDWHIEIVDLAKSWLSASLGDLETSNNLLRNWRSFSAVDIVNANI
jgi:hypothetical protein